MDLDGLMAKEAARQGEDVNTPSSEESSSSAPETTTTTTENALPTNDPPATQTTTDVDVAGKGDQNIAKPSANVDTDAAFIANLERLSGGAIKTTEDLQSALAKIGEYDSLSKRALEAEEKLGKTIFADAYEQRRNELKLAGATKEQLKSFEKINDLGDLKEMDDLEAKIQKLILVDGYGEKVARNKVKKEFDLENTFDDDLDVMKEDLRISAKADREALEAYKTEVSTPSADTKILNEAQKASVIEGLKPVFAQFNEQFKSLAALELKGKNSDQVIPFDLEVSASDKAKMTESIQGYLLGNNLPLTQENYNEALSNARREHLEANVGLIANKVWAKAEAHFTKQLADKYENISGLPRQHQKPAHPLSEDRAAMKAVKNELLNG